MLCCASSLCLRVASLCRRSCVTWSCSFVSQLRRLQMDFGEIFCAGRASEKEKLLRAMPNRLFTDVVLSWRTFAYGEILCIWTRNNQMPCFVTLPSSRDFSGAHTFGSELRVGQISTLDIRTQNIFSVVCGHCKPCALPCSCVARTTAVGTRVVFVGGGKPGNFPLTGSDLPSHWFV